jgi:hypothetical protein
VSQPKSNCQPQPTNTIKYSFFKAYLILISFFTCANVLYSQEKGTGLLFLNDDEYKSIPLASTAMMGTLPTSKDLSSWFPSPGDQGSQSSCVAWAVCYGLKSYQEAVEKRQPPTSTTQVYSPSYVYNQIKISGCGNGSYIKSALELLKREGVTTLQAFPYDQFDCNRQPSTTDKTLARQNAIAEWRTVPLETETDVKSHIASGFPVVIGMMVDEGFQRLRGNFIYSGPSGMEKGGHAMVVVGYDDSRQAFKVLNSWGREWGENGYGWISYSAFKRRVREAYSAQDIVVNDPTNINPNPTTDPIPNIPIPVPSSNISASLSGVNITHNVPVNMPNGQYPGMAITVPGTILNGVGSNAQLVIRFIMPNGQPLVANPQEFFFRDVHGFVAVGSPALPIFSTPAITGTATFAIPYYALNLIPTNFTQTYSLTAVATLYINNFEIAKSPGVALWVKY